MEWVDSSRPVRSFVQFQLTEGSKLQCAALVGGQSQNSSRGVARSPRRASQRRVCVRTGCARGGSESFSKYNKWFLLILEHYDFAYSHWTSRPEVCVFA